MADLDPARMDPKTLAWNIAKALMVILVVVVVIGLVFREPMERVAEGFVNRFGLPGVFVAALLLDAMPGLGSQPIVVLACAGGLPGVWVWLVAGAGSWLSGSMGWTIGLGLKRWPWFLGWVARVGLERGLRKHQRRAIFVASLAPVPYGLITMAAGAVGVPWVEVALGATGRFLKVGLNVAIVVMGWGATANS